MNPNYAHTANKVFFIYLGLILGMNALSQYTVGISSEIL